MERLALKIHYSYAIALACAILFANTQLFVMCTLTMLLHELAHYYVAKARYYKCHRIQLSAFGAVLYGDFDNAYGADQIAIALAGPIANIILCVLCYALWWIAPATYNYTYSLVSANITMALFNLLPAYPLDGGRVVVGIMQCQGKLNGLNVAKKGTVVISVILFVVFVLGVVMKYWLYNVALFAVFLMASSMSQNNTECYTRLGLDYNIRKRLDTGVEKKVLVYNSNVSWGRVVVRMRGHYMYEIHVVDDDINTIGVIEYAKLCQLIAHADSGDTLYKLINAHL